MTRSFLTLAIIAALLAAGTDRAPGGCRTSAAHEARIELTA